MGTEVIAAVVAVLAFGADAEEVADWRVVADLFAIDLGAI